MTTNETIGHAPGGAELLDPRRRRLHLAPADLVLLGAIECGAAI